MRVARSQARYLLRSAAAAGALCLTAACVVPPPGVSPRPTEFDAVAPDVQLYSFDQSYGDVGSGTYSYSVTRDAYAAVFEVDRRGYARVLSPTDSRVGAKVQAGRSYVVYPRYTTQDPEYANVTASDYSQIPYLFVVTADEPLDLSTFSRGGELTRGVRVTDADSPDSTVAALARLVTRDAPGYGADYAFVSPRVYGAGRSLLTECARPVEDVHDYQYYRQLWAVFTPYDPLLGPALTAGFQPALGWFSTAGSYAYLPFAAYRAQLATAAFYGGCEPSSSSPYGSYAYGGYLPSSAYVAYGLAFGLGYGAYGYGQYGYGGYGYGTVPPRVGGTTQTPPRLPRTPNALGSVQVAATGGTAPFTARRLGEGIGAVPRELGWRVAGGTARPGGVQAVQPVGAWAAGFGGARSAGFHGIAQQGPEARGGRGMVGSNGAPRTSTWEHHGSGGSTSAPASGHSYSPPAAHASPPPAMTTAAASPPPSAPSSSAGAAAGAGGGRAGGGRVSPQ